MKTMKCLFPLIALVMLVAGGCKEDPDKPDPITGATTATADNWTKIASESFGLTLSTPAGWTFAKGEKPLSYSNEWQFEFTTEADDFEAAYADFCNHIFGQTAKGSTEGNFQLAIGFDPVSYTKGAVYTEVPYMEILGIRVLLPLWYVKNAKGIHSVDITDYDATKTAVLGLMFVVSDFSK